MSNKEPKQEMKKQETEASNNDLYNPLKDVPPSSPSNLPQVGHLNYVPGNNDDIFLARLRKHVGPNLEKLINPDETPQQAYERHMQVIGAASRRITDPEQLVKWLENPAHANYYFPEKGFNRVIKNVSDLRVAVDLSTQSARRLIEYVLTDENDSVFARLFCNIEALQAFAANFARKDVRRVIEGMFVNPDAFEGIFKDELALAKFKKSFPGYADQATNFFMLKRQSLDAIKYLRKRVEEGWGQRAPKVSSSSPDVGSGTSSSSFIQTVVAGQGLSAANDPTEKASKGQKQKLAIAIPAPLFGKTALSGEVSPVTQNLPAANDSKPQEDYFSAVFSNTADGPAQVLQDLLIGESHKNLSQTSRANREIYDVETTYKKLLQEKNIGPDFARLRNAGETYQAAYQRHLPIIRGLAPINTHAELAHRLATHPDYYYFNRLVSENDFARLFLDDFDGLLNFCHDFPLHTDRILEHVLTDAAVFDQVIRERMNSVALATTFPMYAERFIERVLADADAFARVIRDSDDLEALADLPAAYAERFLERVLADTAAFARVTQDADNLEALAALPAAYAERFIARVLADADAFARVTQSGAGLQRFVTAFPAYAERFLERVLADADAFARVTHNADSVDYISHLPAAYAERFLDGVLADAAAFARVTQRAYDLRRIATAFPAYAERFFERVLADADAFARVTQSPHDLQRIATLPVAYVERFFKRVFITDTAAFARVGALIEQVIRDMLPDTPVVARMIGNTEVVEYYLKLFAPYFPAHAERAEAFLAAREAARAEAKHNVQPIHVSRTGPLSPTAPAADFEMFSSSASQAVITQQTLLAVDDSKGETKEGPRQNTAKTCPPSSNTNVSVSSSRFGQVTVEEPKQEIKEREVKVQSSSTSQSTPEILSSSSSRTVAVNDSKPQEYYFDSVFGNTADGPAQVLQDLLIGESHKNLSQTSRANREIYDVETTYKKLLQENIGPDVARLRNAGETYQAAYQRHLTIIRGLAPINTPAELAHRLATYPDYYYFNRLVTKDDFARLFLRGSLALLNFCRDFPLHTDRILEHVLTDAAAFAHVTRRGADLRRIVTAFPAYAERVVEQVLADADAFDRVTKRVDDLEESVGLFATYAERVIEEVLTDAAAFAHVTRSGADLRRIVTAFPAYAERVIEQVLADADAFDRVTKKMGSDMEQIAKSFPAYAERFFTPFFESLLKQVSANADALSKLIESAEELVEMADLSVLYAGRFLEQVLADAAAFARVIRSGADLRRIVTVFPAYAERVIERVLTDADADAFDRVTGCTDDLKILVDLPAVYAERFIARVLADADAFDRLIRSGYGVWQVATTFPAYAERVVERVLADAATFARVTGCIGDLEALANLPTAYAEQFFERVLADAGAFARVTQNTYYLRIIDLFTDVYAERYIVQVLADADAFARVVRDKNDLKYFLRYVAPSFPDYAKRAEALFAARETALADAKHSVQPTHVSRTGPLSPTAPAADFERFSSSASQAVITQQTLLAVNDAKGETKEGPRQSTAKACPSSPDTNVSVSSSAVDQVTITVQASPAVNEAKEEMSGGQKPKLAVAIPVSLFGKPQLLEALSPVIQKPSAANEVNNHDLENQSELPKKGKCCWIL